jgi:hypothetical protein
LKTLLLLFSLVISVDGYSQRDSTNFKLYVPGNFIKVCDIANKGTLITVFISRRLSIEYKIRNGIIRTKTSVDHGIGRILYK